jgi:hypothetical protein
MEMKMNENLVVFPGNKHVNKKLSTFLKAVEKLAKSHQVSLTDVCLTSRPLNDNTVETVLNVDFDVSGLYGY